MCEKCQPYQIANCVYLILIIIILYKCINCGIVFTFKHETKHWTKIDAFKFLFNLISYIDLHDGLLYIDSGEKRGKAMSFEYHITYSNVCIRIHI